MKAQNLKKRRAQRGRPRLEDVVREPNGRPARSRNTKAQEDPRKAGRDARVRLFDLPESWTDNRGKTLTRDEIAASEYAGTVIGRLLVNGIITWPMYDAGLELLDRRLAAKRAYETPVEYGASSWAKQASVDDAPTTVVQTRQRATVRDWEAMGPVESALDRETRLIREAWEYMTEPQLAYTEAAIKAEVNYSVFRDMLEDRSAESWKCVEEVALNNTPVGVHMHWAVRDGLSFLARKFGLEKDPEAA